MTIDLSANSKFIQSLQLSRRDEFFNALKKVFYEETGQNLPIYGVVINPYFCSFSLQPNSKLKDYATSKKDMKKGHEILPEETYRLKQED